MEVVCARRSRCRERDILTYGAARSVPRQRGDGYLISVPAVKAGKAEVIEETGRIRIPPAWRMDRDGLGRCVFRAPCEGGRSETDLGTHLYYREEYGNYTKENAFHMVSSYMTNSRSIRLPSGRMNSAV